MSKIIEKVWVLSEPVVQERGCSLWDVEYAKEAGGMFLRIYIDKEGGVGIDDCEAISRRLDPLLDEADLIQESYTFEVSSAGLERALKRPSDFAAFQGHSVELRLYRPKDGKKEYVGKLAGYEDGAVEIEAAGQRRRFEKNEVASVRLRME